MFLQLCMAFACLPPYELVFNLFLYNGADHGEELCLLSIDRGACGGSQTRYAFNRQTSQCVPFTYTGCGGNLNNFVSMADCMATCGNVGFR